MRGIAATIATVCALTIGSAAQAATLAGYPAPGGTSFSGSDNPFSSSGPNTGTATWTYSGFDPSEWDQLWWGFEDLELAMDGAIDELGEAMSLASMSGATIVYEGMTSIDAGDVFTRAVATIVSGGSNWIDPTTVGILSPNIFAVSEVDGTVPFVVTFAVTASGTYDAGGAGYVPWFNYFDPNTGPSEDGNSRTSFYRNFYYTTAEVPLPAGLPLLLAGLAGLVVVRRRKRG
ncbi:VPLPA-CTERM sorting domain-containing protein [Pacificoceanicola onchidii]|uniref:VPLPA-CTERM sorting domain-containing protein n=1 Tax=Pacificoceanicola onchidii TaxID=2562685 RepID=UPI0010A42187|nr:VPLPA-CTERM sorting domain-containing protein [Pacificoceanicola onchidii]